MRTRHALPEHFMVCEVLSCPSFHSRWIDLLHSLIHLIRIELLSFGRPCARYFTYAAPKYEISFIFHCISVTKVPWLFYT